MATRERPRDRAIRVATADLRRLGADLRQARVSAGLSLREVGSQVDLSASQVSRIERALVPGIGLRPVAMLGAVVGLDVRIRAYPGGDPARDAGQRALLDRLRRRLHAGVRLDTEIPLPTPGYLRAWDGWLAGLRGARSTLPAEAETHVADWQAMERRLARKQRDADEPDLLLVVADTRHNRVILAGAQAEVATRYPVPARRALAALSRGEHPGGSALVLL
jgi:transcriptional regulator with XRE-family HTH domain